MQWQLNESNEKKQKQLVYISELETTLVDTDRVLKKLSDDFLEKEQEFKSREGRQRALTTNFLRQNKTIKFHLVTVSVDRQQVGTLYVVKCCFSLVCSKFLSIQFYVELSYVQE